MGVYLRLPLASIGLSLRKWTMVTPGQNRSKCYLHENPEEGAGVSPQGCSGHTLYPRKPEAQSIGDHSCLAAWRWQRPELGDSDSAGIWGEGYWKRGSQEEEWQKSPWKISTLRTGSWCALEVRLWEIWQKEDQHECRASRRWRYSRSHPVLRQCSWHPVRGEKFIGYFVNI